MKKNICLILVLVIFALVFISCNGEPEAPKVYHTVTFDAGVSAQSVEEGRTAYKPANPDHPTDAELIFDAWYLDGSVYDFSTPVYTDISLTVGWKYKTYKVTYTSINAHATLPQDTKEYKKGDTVTVVTTGNWSKTVNGSTVSSFTLDGDTTLYETDLTFSEIEAFKTTCIVNDDTSYETTLYFDPDWFFGKDANSKDKNLTYSKDICNFASLLMLDVYNNPFIKISTLGTGNNVSSNCSYFDYASGSSITDKSNIYSALNFEDITPYSLKEADYSDDKYDLVNFVIAHKEYNSGTNSLVIVSIEGSTSDNAWLSNMDVGYNGTALYGGTTHTEWKNKNNHKGFDVAANRVKEKIDAYIQANCSTATNVSILLTGHSRGGAIANILGAYYEKSQTVKSFTYTFACPLNTVGDGTTYSSIFNMLNSDDLVPLAPPVKEFVRYGKDISVDMSKTANKTAYKTKVGVDFVSANISSWIESLNWCKF